MNITPVVSYAEPKYPVKNVLDDHPELLKLVPKRWQGNPAVLAALAGVCLMVSSARLNADQQKVQPAQKSLVAPVFQHGEGRGSFGCVATNPPVFLSEDEARQVIVEEAKRAGIKFAADKQVLYGLNIKRTDTACFSTQDDESDSQESAIKNEPDGSKRIRFGTWGAQKRREEKPVSEITLDGTDKRLNISYEYVSESDFKGWKTDYPRISSTVTCYNLQAVARDVQANIQANKPQGTYVVFYDPMLGQRNINNAEVILYGPMLRRREISNSEILNELSSVEERRAAYERNDARVREASKNELRKQVKDFIKWLKSEGVI